MQTSFFSALLAAFMLHVVGLAAVSLGWKAWCVSGAIPPPDTPVLVAVVPVPEPAPPPAPTPEPVTPPVPMPPADVAPEPIPAAPVVSAPLAPLQDVAPEPLKQVKPRPKPMLAQVRTPRSTPGREPLPRPSLPAPARPDALLESTGSGTAALSSVVPAADLASSPGGGADPSQLSAHGDVAVAPGSGVSAYAAATGGDAGSGAGAGRGGGGGGGVAARPLGGYQVKPRYPESARRQGVEGTVLLKMRITAQGRVEDLQVERSAGHRDLDQSALEAVQRWHFEPARRSGVWVLLPVEFKLQ